MKATHFGLSHMFYTVLTEDVSGEIRPHRHKDLACNKTTSKQQEVSLEEERMRVSDFMSAGSSLLKVMLIHLIS